MDVKQSGLEQGYPYNDSNLQPLEEICLVDQPEFGDDIFSFRGKFSNSATGQLFLFTAYGLEASRVISYLKSIRVNCDAQPVIDDDRFDDVDVDPVKNKEYAREFLLEKKANLLVQIKWDRTTQSDEEKKGSYEVNFDIDPILDSDGVDDYQFKCAKSARARPDLRNGSGNITVRLFRAGQQVRLTNADAANNPFPNSISDSFGKTTTYDLRVTGNTGSVYQLQGSWIESGASLASNACR